ncbi:MAG: efflux RND transporter periplasmic adaptor subunit [Planctomycetes bacterium]|nr:efflux RND transporter periplasmic adaptor subunit [Planctomycetota bacterium]
MVASPPHMAEISPPTGAPDLKRLRIERPTAEAPRSGGARPRRGLRWGWLLALAAAAAAWWFRAELQQAAGLETNTALLVRTVFVRSEVATPAGAIGSNGYIVARRRASLSTVLSGLLVEMKVEEGQRVEADQVIARIQFDDYAVNLRTRDLAIEVLARQRVPLEQQAAAAKFAIERAEKERETARMELEQARASERLAQIEIERQRPLHATGDFPSLDLDRLVAAEDRAKAGVAAAEARVAAATAGREEAEAQAAARAADLLRLDADSERARSEKDAAAILLERTYVRAPFAGVIVRKNAEEGEVVASTGGQGNSRGSVAELVDFDSLEVQVELPETRILQVKESPSAQVFFDAEPTRAWPAKVSRIWPTADRAKATIEVRVAFPEGGIPPIARPEMGVRVSFAPPGAAAPTKTAPEMLVPRAALFDLRGERAAVFVVEDAMLKRVELELGAERGESRVVRSGLRSGAEVVLDPAPTWREGQMVRRG